MAVDDAADDVGEVGLWFDADELAGLDQGSDGRPVLGPAVGAGEECILPIEGERTDGALDGVGVDLDAPVLEEEAEAGPAGEGVADGLGRLDLLAEERELLAQPRLQRLDQRPRALLTGGTTLLGRAASDLSLDPVEGGDPRQGLGRDRRRATLGELVEGPADMAPAEGELHFAARGQHLVPAIAVDLQHAAEAGEMGDRPLRLAVGRIDIGHARRGGAAPGAGGPGLGPEPAGLGPSPPA